MGKGGKALSGYRSAISQLAARFAPVREWNWCFAVRKFFQKLHRRAMGILRFARV
jgi:hypothetical protein